MKISNIKMQHNDKSFHLSAICSTDKGYVEKVYFQFPKKYAPYAVMDASPFAAALLLPAMKLREDIIVEGSISSKLFEGMHEIMDTVYEWNVGLEKVSIIADRVSSDTECGDVVTTFFSGGVDSFYTWLKHKKDDLDPVSTMLFVNGFDISLDNTALYKATISNIQNIAKKEKANLIEAESNIRSFIDPILGWGMAHGGCLAATALCLRRGIKVMYIPSSYTIEQEHAWGSHRLIDPSWGTESIKFAHDGFEVSRVNKVKQEVSQSRVALDYLRVCWKELGGSYNCGRCSKCIRTMVNLHVANALDECKTFPHELDPKLIADTKLDEADVMFVQENINALKVMDADPAIIEAHEKALRNSLDRSIIKKFLKFCLQIDARCFNGKTKRLVARAKSAYGK